MRGLVNFFLFVLVTAAVCAGLAGAAYVMSDRYVSHSVDSSHTEIVPTVAPTTAPLPTTDPAAQPEPTTASGPTTPSASATPNATATPPFTTWVVTAQQPINVRDCPAETCNRIALLQPGSDIQVLDTVDQWHEITLDDGRIGYIATNLTREATPAP